MTMKQTHEKYWFKRRRRGWGWFPVTWQGWLCLLAMIAVMAGDVYFVAETPLTHRVHAGDMAPGQAALFFAILAADVLALVVVCYAKGPKPRWRWGKKPGDDPREDF